jgi:hypothetical protein
VERLYAFFGAKFRRHPMARPLVASRHVLRSRSYGEFLGQKLYTLVENGLCHTRGLKLWCTSGVSLGQSLHEQGRTKILAVVRFSCFCGDLHFSHVHDIAARIWSSHGIPQAETSVIAPPARTLCASQ